MAARHRARTERPATPPTATSPPPQCTRATLLSWIGGERAVDDVAAYFADRSQGDGARIRLTYTGSRFEALAGGGDRPEAANRITADDVLAVKLLSVDIPAHISLDLLEGDLGGRVSALLAQVPASAVITDPEAAAHLARYGALEQAWDLLCARHGVGWVSASKLLARKRPHLVPVYDRVVRCAFGAPPRPWSWLREQFSTSDLEDEASSDVDLAERLHRLRGRAGAPDHVSVLRLLDVVVWMRHHRTHRAVRCPGAGVHDLETT